MGVLDKFLDVMKLNEDDEYDDDEYFEDDDPYYEEERPARKSFLKRNSRAKVQDDYDDEEDDYEDEPAPAPSKLFGRQAAQQKPAQTSSARALPARTPAKKNAMEVCVMRPTAVDDSRTIAETLMGNRTVVLNLEGLDIEVAQRIIDFVSGATYALNGNLQKVSQYIFLLTPANVDISGDLNDLFGMGIPTSSASMGSRMMNDEDY